MLAFVELVRAGKLEERANSVKTTGQTGAYLSTAGVKGARGAKDIHIPDRELPMTTTMQCIHLTSTRVMEMPSA